MSVILLSRTPYYRALVQNMTAQNPGILTGASFGLLLGLLLVVVHNFWVWEPRVFITIISWIILIKSLIWLSFPEKMLKFTQKTVAGPAYYVIIALMFIVGVILITKGFYLYIPDEHIPFD
ncbi:hypothetical protein [Legionella londiniensis]|nr:hypothetical protein [Legionella londiniensis]